MNAEVLPWLGLDENPDAPERVPMTLQWESDLYYVLRLQTLGPLRDLKFHFVPFVEGFESGTLDAAVVHKNIVSGLATDESVAFFRIKPLNSSPFFHRLSFPRMLPAPWRNGVPTGLSSLSGFSDQGAKKETAAPPAGY